MIVRAFGRSIYVDFPPIGGSHIASAMRKDGWYEKSMLLDIRRRLRSRVHGVALDIGAYCGTHTLWLAGVCRMEVVSFEPAPDSFKSLAANVRRNRVGMRVRLVQAAVGAEAGRGKVVVRNAKNTGMSVVDRIENGDVPIVTIDSYGFDNVTLMKIDVEGSELGVLRGAAETIKRCRPLLYIECQTPELHNAVAEFLAPLGYSEFGVFNATPTYGFATAEEVVKLPSVTLSTAIMAHPRRERHIPYLLRKLGRDVEVVWDQHNNRWDTGRRSLLAFDPAAEYHLVVQDDVIVCEDFIPGVRAAIAATPECHPLCFYINTARSSTHLVNVVDRVRRAKAGQYSLFAMQGPWWGPAVAIPTRIIPELVEWCDKQTKVDNYDMRLALFFRSRHLDCYYTVPNLVDHRVGPSEPSLVPGRSSSTSRVAMDFIGENESALSVAWSLE